MNMGEINWLNRAEAMIVKDEELDQPYAWYGRICTRREFEELREEVKTKRQKAYKKLDEINEANKKLFFENLQWIRDNKEAIYTNKELRIASPIRFWYQINFPIGIADHISFPVSVMLKIWENGDWLRKCPKCGNKGLQYRTFLHKNYCYCEHCKEFYKVGSRFDVNDKNAVKRAINEIFPQGGEDYLSLERCMESISPEELEKRKKRQENECRIRSAIEEKWQNEYDKIPANNEVGREMFKIALYHGKHVADFLAGIKGSEEIIAKDVVPVRVMKFLEQLRTVTDSANIKEE